MKRRTFLTVAGGLALVSRVRLPRSARAAAIDRKARWAPQPNDLVQWRYVAGRAGDFGFIVSLTDIHIPFQTPVQELLVERKDFSGAQAFAAGSYLGALAYDPASATYSFQGAQNGISATWQWDEAAGVYRLSVASPELTLSNVALRPQGEVIREAGDGTIGVGSVRGIAVDSDYHADWAAVEIDGTAQGVARVDMQGLYSPGFPLAATGDDYDHHWFAIAGQAGGHPVWVSCWRIESAGSVFWDVTVAKGGPNGYTSVESFTEQNSLVEPLAVQPVELQPLPADAGAELAGWQAGRRWRVTAGRQVAGDLLDLDISVAPGQFAKSARFGAAGGLAWMEEALGSTTASGTVAGQPLSNVRLVVAESTAEYEVAFVPLARR
jgi:hypothetical protein